MTFIVSRIMPSITLYYLGSSMRKDSKKIIEIVVGIIFFLFFATGVGTMIWLIFRNPDEKVGLIVSIISEVICLPASIASFLAAFALEKNYKAR